MIRPNEDQVWQIMTVTEYGIPVLQSWHETKKEAEQEMADYKRIWPEAEWNMVQGTDEINFKCHGCESIYCMEQHDHYGMSTGYWCDDCYEHNYPYRKDAYFDPGYAGERMDDDY